MANYMYFHRSYYARIPKQFLQLRIKIQIKLSRYITKSLYLALSNLCCRCGVFKKNPAFQDSQCPFTSHPLSSHPTNCRLVSPLLMQHNGIDNWPEAVDQRTDKLFLVAQHCNTSLWFCSADSVFCLYKLELSIKLFLLNQLFFQSHLFYVELPYNLFCK